MRLGGGNRVGTFFETLRPERKAVPVPVEDLQAVAATAREQVEMSGERIQIEMIPHQRMQPVEASPHVARRQADVDAHTRREVNHARRAARTNCRMAASAPLEIRSRSPPAKISSRGAAQSGAGFVSISAKRTGLVDRSQPSPPMIEGTGAHTLLAAESRHAQTALFLFRDRLRPVPAPVFPHVTTMRGRQCLGQSGSPAAQPIEKSTAGASLLAHIIVAKWADHQPLHRQQQMLARHGVEISRKTMGGWLAQCAGLLEALYGAAKKELFGSHVVGTDDTGVKVLDRKLPFARTGRIWPYVGDARHPVIVYDYTPTRARAGPAKFLEGYKGCLQADAYSVYE